MTLPRVMIGNPKGRERKSSPARGSDRGRGSRSRSRSRKRSRSPRARERSREKESRKHHHDSDRDAAFKADICAQMDARFSQIMDMIMVQGSRSAHSDEKDDDDDEHTAPASDSWAKDKMTKSFFHSRWFDDQIDTPSDSKEQKEAHKEAKALREGCEPLLKKGDRKKILRRMFPSLFVSRKRRLTASQENLISIAKEMLNKEINNALTRNTDSLRQVSSLRGAVVAGEASPEEIAEALMDIGRVLIDNNVKLANLLAHYGMRGRLQAHGREE